MARNRPSALMLEAALLAALMIASFVVAMIG